MFLQLSENSSLLSAEDTISERVRFDDNVSFIDEVVVKCSSSSEVAEAVANPGIAASEATTLVLSKLHKV